MSILYPAPIATNAGSDIEAKIQLLGSDGNPIDVDPLAIDAVTITLRDVSPTLGTPAVTPQTPYDQGWIIVSIPWDEEREVGVNYGFRVKYEFTSEGIVQTTPLYGVIYQ